MLDRGRPDVIGHAGQGAACRAESLTKIYGRRDTAVHALQDITLSIPERGFTAIMGPSGSGKSTLLHCLAALDTPTSGHVFLGHTDLTTLSRRQQAQVRRDRIGFVFQAFNLVPTLNALENITLPQQLAGRRPDRAWLNYVISTLGLANRLQHRPSELSGGQQQRVALARALVGRPDVIFADEPTGNLDTTASREMLELLRSAVDEYGQTVVTVTHDPMIASYADQVLFFSDGQVVDHALRPETSEVQQHLQYLDTGSSARDPQQLRPQGDGRQDMRSRRRRRTEDTAPGRPMVGSDDEVEVARQERWLQRIREQFEVEMQAGHAGNAADVRSRHAAAAAAMQDPVQPINNDDEGWLPAERSWITAASPEQSTDEDAVGSSEPPPPANEQVAWQRADDHVWQASTGQAATQDTDWLQAQPEYDEWSPTQPTPSDPRPPAPAEPISSPPVYAEWQGWSSEPEVEPSLRHNGRRAADAASSAPSGGWQVGDDEVSHVRDTVDDPQPRMSPRRDTAITDERSRRRDERWRTADLDERRWQAPADDVWGDVGRPDDGWSDVDPRADHGWSDDIERRADDDSGPIDDAELHAAAAPEPAPEPAPPNGGTSPAWLVPPAAQDQSSRPRQSNGRPLDALQSLQEQLDRLGGSSRRARAGGRAPRGDGPSEPHPDRNGHA